MPKKRKRHESKSNDKGSSSTKGRDKGANCHKSPLKNLYCNDSRLHRKNPNLWMAAVREVQSIQTVFGQNTLLHEIAVERGLA